TAFFWYSEAERSQGPPPVVGLVGSRPNVYRRAGWPLFAFRSPQNARLSGKSVTNSERALLLERPLRRAPASTSTAWMRARGGASGRSCPCWWGSYVVLRTR